MKIEEVWVEKYRPKTLDEMVLSEKNRQYFASIKSITNNYLFLGTPGTGKNTMAYYLRDKFAPDSYLYLNASSESGIETVRNKITDFVSTTAFDGNNKLVILSEFDGFSNAAQGALREIMEQYLDTVRFILTANHQHKIITAIQSRCGEPFFFNSDIKDITKRIIHILNAEKICNWKDHSADIVKIIKQYAPDLRKITNVLQRCFETGKFIPLKIDSGELVEKIWQMVRDKTDPFVIRKFVIDNEHEFGNDYHTLMRQMFDCSVVDNNVGACLQITEYMYRNSMVMDNEVNFTGLIINLVKK